MDTAGSMHAQALLPQLKAWFDDYVAHFVSEDPLTQETYDLKIVHTHRVCAAAKDIAISENLTEEDICLAEMAALLHDIGRFEQYRQYGTFVDARSVDHAALGVKVLRTEQPLKALQAPFGDMIARVVQYHNRAALPSKEDARCLLLLKIVRDADKVDIWRVVTDYYQNMDTRRNKAIGLDLPDEPHITQAVYDALMSGTLVRMSDLETLNDFKLLQLAWIFDLNFPRTFQMVREANYLEKIYRTLPRNSRRVARIIERLRIHLECR